MGGAIPPGKDWTMDRDENATLTIDGKSFDLPVLSQTSGPM